MKNWIFNLFSISKLLQTVNGILVCAYFSVPKGDVLGKKKSKDIVEPRMIAQYLIDEYLGLPLLSIGKFFGRDHSTIVYARDKISERLKTDVQLQEVIAEIKNNI